MIVLLNCSTSLSKNENDTIPSTGELIGVNDSILVAIDDLRKANAKMVELKYEKEINDSLRSIIIKDDNIIREYNNINNSLQKQIIQIKKQRNIVCWGGVGIALSLVISLIIK